MGSRILIADDLVTDRIALKARLGPAHQGIVSAGTYGELLARLNEGLPDAILLNIGFAGGGIGACAALRTDARYSDVPVVVYGASDDRPQRMAAISAGADDCLTGLPGEGLLAALLRSYSRDRALRGDLMRRCDIVRAGCFAEARAPFAPKPRTMVVAPTAAQGVVWRQGLADLMRGDVGAVLSEDALNVSQIAAPDAYVIAETVQNPLRALRLVSELRARPGTRHAVILYQLADSDHDGADMALDLGATAVIPGPFDARDVAIRLDRRLTRKWEEDGIRAMVEHRLDEALRDPLTGLFNRRYAEGYLDRLIGDTEAGQGRAFTVMLLDIDHFKEVNDRFGHLSGDDVLRGVAERLRGELRDGDLAARIGGEEFLVVLPDTGEDTAFSVAERLRRVMSVAPIVTENARVRVTITLSIGVLVVPGGPNLDRRTILDSADRALYASKNAGRNLVTLTHAQSAA